MADKLVKVQGKLAQPTQVATPLRVGDLLRRLETHFPQSDGESWDVYGLTVGDKDAVITRVAIALDATVANVRKAKEAGANVLITHHPPFLQAPGALGPDSQVYGAGGVLWEAATSGVALMNFHTALDAQPEATTVLPDMLNLVAGSVFEPTPYNPQKGYGRVCTLRQDDALTLGQLASRCTSVFGRTPRVWGDFDMPLETVVTWAGSLGSAVKAHNVAGISTIVCGEVRYHDALDISQAGVGLIELGHDVSELPYALLLGKAVRECGVDQGDMVLLDRGPHWACPEAIRL